MGTVRELMLEWVDGLLVVGVLSFFFFNDTATTEIYTLSLHDALPISRRSVVGGELLAGFLEVPAELVSHGDRKSTRLNSSHLVISYAVFCLKKKKQAPPPDHSCAYSHQSCRRHDGPPSRTLVGHLPSP